jgi:hypothetical protein
MRQVSALLTYYQLFALAEVAVAMMNQLTTQLTMIHQLTTQLFYQS